MNKKIKQKTARDYVTGWTAIPLWSAMGTSAGVQEKTKEYCQAFFRGEGKGQGYNKLKQFCEATYKKTFGREDEPDESQIPALGVRVPSCAVCSLTSALQTNHYVVWYFQEVGMAISRSWDGIFKKLRW